MGNNAGSFRALLTVFMLGLFRPVKSHTSQLLYLGLFVVVLVLGSHTLWVRYADRILQHDDYVLSADMIELTSVPPWIRTDIKRQAFDQGSLDGLSLAQPKLAVRVADAFALHPWVSQVKRVNPNYRRVVVDLEYRKPVAMVWVTHMVEGQPKFGLYPVDAGGIFLPSADFYATNDSQDPGQASEHDPNNADYLQIEVANDDNVWPAAAEGSSWGDERVHGAARLSASLLDAWKRLGLERIVVITLKRDDGTVAPPSYRLVTRDGAAIIWGSSPGRERTGEPTPQQKITRMLDLVELHDKLPASPLLDLRTAGTPAAAAPAALTPFKRNRRITPTR